MIIVVSLREGALGRIFRRAGAHLLEGRKFDRRIKAKKASKRLGHTMK